VLTKNIDHKLGREINFETKETIYVGGNSVNIKHMESYSDLNSDIQAHMSEDRELSRIKHSVRLNEIVKAQGQSGIFKGTVLASYRGKAEGSDNQVSFRQPTVEKGKLHRGKVFKGTGRPSFATNYTADLKASGFNLRGRYRNSLQSSDLDDAKSHWVEMDSK
jgi:ABC-type nitrate/sulfonate/bicarbonate transport system ATPase subunit